MAFNTLTRRAGAPYDPDDLTREINENFAKTVETSLSTLTDGEFLVYDGSSTLWINATAAEAGIPQSIANLNDVTVASVADGEFLIWDGSSASWINATAAEAGVPQDIEDLTNVSIATPADGDVLTYDASSGAWINGTGAAGDLAGLTDTSLSTLSDGEVLTWDGSSNAWINGAGGGGSSTLADLTDTTITSPADGQFLSYDSASSKWVNGSTTVGTTQIEKTYTDTLTISAAASGTWAIPANTVSFNAKCVDATGTASGTFQAFLRKQSDGAAASFDYVLSDMGGTVAQASSATFGHIVSVGAASWVAGFELNVQNPRSTSEKTKTYSSIHCSSGGSDTNDRVWIQNASTAEDHDELEVSCSAGTLTGTVEITYTVLEDATAIVATGGTTTVASLPSGAAGDTSFVTDANATTFASIVAGGGANGVPVYHDGTNWRIG